MVNSLLFGCSQNSGFSPQIIHFNRVFHYFHRPFWGFHPYFWFNTHLGAWIGSSCSGETPRLIVRVLLQLGDLTWLKGWTRMGKIGTSEDGSLGFWISKGCLKWMGVVGAMFRQPPLGWKNTTHLEGASTNYVYSIKISMGPYLTNGPLIK